MYQFTALKTEQFLCSSKILNLNLFPEYNEVYIKGILKSLFGEPLYESEDYEQAYSYIIKATDKEGKEWLFDVYQGCTGSAVGAEEDTNELRKVLDEFQALLRETKPVDFHYEGHYIDSYMKIIYGIKDGKPYYDEIPFEDDEIEEI